MEESTLLKLSLSFSLIGMVILLFLTRNLEPEEQRINNLSGMEETSQVKLVGVISSVNDYGKTLFVEISQPQKIRFVLFRESNLTLVKGEFIELTGELREYRGKKEIIASKITQIE